MGLTGSIGLALMLWVIGGLITAAGLAVYLVSLRSLGYNVTETYSALGMGYWSTTIWRREERELV